MLHVYWRVELMPEAKIKFRLNFFYFVFVFRLFYDYYRLTMSGIKLNNDWEPVPLEFNYTSFRSSSLAWLRRCARGRALRIEFGVFRSLTTLTHSHGGDGARVFIIPAPAGKRNVRAHSWRLNECAFCKHSPIKIDWRLPIARSARWRSRFRSRHAF